MLACITDICFLFYLTDVVQHSYTHDELYGGIFYKFLYLIFILILILGVFEL